MKVFVKLIATYRAHLPFDAIGNKVQVDVQPGTTVAEVLTPYNVPLDSQSVIVVNGLSVPLDTPLNDGDTVTAFSAIAGG